MHGIYRFAALLLSLTIILLPTIPAFGASYVVSKTADTNDGACNADCSLREAIVAANASAANDTITFAAAANGTITLASALPNVANNGTLTITGNGTTNTIISGGNTVRGLTEVESGANLSVSGVRVTQGSAFEGAAILSHGTLSVTNSLFDNNVAEIGGGAIRNDAGTLTVTSSTFDTNRAQRGGAIRSDTGTLTITASQITGNTSTAAGSGAAVYAGGSITIINSVIRGNTGELSDGAGFSNAAGTVNIYNSTISGNTATAMGGILNNNGTINLYNTILANNTASFVAQDCGGGGTINAQNSLIEGEPDCVTGTNTNNLTGDPELDSNLMATPGSPVINAGNNSLIPGGVTTDLAGGARIRNGTVDMGAYETVLVALNVQFSVQGRTQPAPHSSRVMTAHVQVQSADGTTVWIDTDYVSDGSSIIVIPNLPAGTYRFWFKGTHTLARLQTATISSAANNITTSTLLEGDANDSNSVTIGDFSILAATFGIGSGAPGYDARADFNGDGAVTIADFSLLASNFGTSGDPTG